MHECEYYQELMSRLLDEGVTETEEQELREHMRSCPECAKLFSALSAVTVSLREEDMAEPPAELAEGVMARIAADKAAGPKVIHVQRPELEPERPRHKKRGWASLAVAACLVLVMGSGAFWFFQGRDKSAPTEGTASEMAYARAADQSAPVAEAPQEAPEPAPAAEEAAGRANDAGQPMTVAEDSALAVAADPGEAEEAIPTETPVPEPLTVRDVARRNVGTIAVDDIPAFTALLEGGSIIGGAQGDWEFLFSVEYGDREVSFATNENESRLVWWDDDHPVTAAHGSLDDLRDIVELDEPPVPK